MSSADEALHSDLPLVFDIKRFAIHDGPGIRTTIFLKGCPLHCLWCHNPEGIVPRPIRLYTRHKCIGCRTCVEACPQQALQLTSEGIAQVNECSLCGTCARECPTCALEIAGERRSVSELMDVVERERGVMEESGGGVTLCGGEPLMHPSWAMDLLRELGRRGHHRAVDTTLYAPQRVVEDVLPLCDLFLIDIKHMDSHLHQRFTGVPNEQILSNIRLVSQRGARFWIRIPLIDKVNADDENLVATARFLSSLPTPPEVVCLLPYHDVGKGKHERMGTAFNPDALPMLPPSQEMLQHAVELLSPHVPEVRIGG